MELKDVTDYLKLGDVENIDQFKEKFNARFFTEDQVMGNKDLMGKFTGVTLGKVQDNIDKIAKSFGVVVSDEERKALKIEDFVNKAFEEKEKEFQESMAKAKDLASKGADEKFTELNALNEKLKSKIGDLEDLNKSTVEKYENEIKGWNGRLNDFKVNHSHQQFMGSLKFAPDTDELRREGFESRLKNKYKLDIDENDNIFIVRREDNKRIENPDKHGEFLSPADVYKKEAMEAKLLAKNPDAGKPHPRHAAPQPPGAPPSGVPNYTGQPAEPTPRPGRTIAPGAVVQ